MKTFKEEANAIGDKIVAYRRRLHAMAECGFDLPNTRNFVKNTLQSMGYDPKECGKGLACELSSAHTHAPTVLLRADMDALPLPEETRLPFRAENGHMHACGHDMHTAMLLGAAAVLKEHEGALPVRVRFAFQSAEETLSGASEMLRAGILTGVKAALMLHAVTAVPFPTGTVLLPPKGIAAPAARFFEITVTGKSAHVGEAERGADALKGAVTLYREMERVKEEIGEGLLLSVGKLHAGVAANVVPAKAVIAGSFRARDENKMADFEKKLSSLCRARTGGVSASVSFLGGCPPLQNDARCLARIKDALPRHGVHAIETPPSKGNAAEDFAVLARECPAVALALAAGERARGYEHPLHHPKVLFDEDALPVGAAVYAIGALALCEL